MIGQIVKKARQNAGMTQEVLADIADVPRSQLQVIEKGGNVTRDTLQKVLAALNLSMVILHRDDVLLMKRALHDLDSIMTLLAGQLDLDDDEDPHPWQVLSPELEEILRARRAKARGR